MGHRPFRFVISFGGATTRTELVEDLSRFDDLDIGVQAHHVELTPDVEATAATRAAEWNATTEQVLGSPHIYPGAPDRIVDQLQEQRDRLGISFVVFTAASLDAVRSVVSRLAGT